MEYGIIIWPAALDQVGLEEIENVISLYGTITKRKERRFNYIGLRNLMIQLYAEEKWAGNFWNHFKHMHYKLDPCYREDKSTYLYMVESVSLENTLAMKEEVRTLCNCGKMSIHSADEESESRMLEKIFFSDLTCDVMNRSEFDKYRLFTGCFSHFCKKMKIEGISREQVIIVSRAVLSLYGERTTLKLSWTSKEKLPDSFEKYNKNEFLEEIQKAGEKLFDEKQYIYFFGIPFVGKDVISLLK